MVRVRAFPLNWEIQRSEYALAWGSIMVFDFIVFVLTLARPFRLGVVWRQGLFYVILRDGKSLSVIAGRSLTEHFVTLGSVYFGYAYLTPRDALDGSPHE